MVDLSHWDVVDSFEDAKDDGVVGIIHKATESKMMRSLLAYSGAHTISCGLAK
ncbi:MAG: hypothetical protein WB614_24735 [Pseudolabrys sp.]